VAIAYIGVGANLGRPEEQLQLASVLLSNHYAIQVLKSSSIYRSDPIGILPYGHQGLDCYVNAVWQIRTSLSPDKLLSVLQSVELRLGRKRLRSGKNFPRKLDLDLLLYGMRRFSTKTLTVPHPRMHKRQFVLKPLAEISPRMIVPGVGRVQNLVKQNRIMAQTVELLAT
jgi:2-amino-4-hydroxy-6-hydroxymethyldihydropteridine diphosphokinase